MSRFDGFLQLLLCCCVSFSRLSAHSYLCSFASISTGCIAPTFTSCPRWCPSCPSISSTPLPSSPSPTTWSGSLTMWWTSSSAPPSLFLWPTAPSPSVRPFWLSFSHFLLSSVIFLLPFFCLVSFCSCFVSFYFFLYIFLCSFFFFFLSSFIFS